MSRAIQPRLKSILIDVAPERGDVALLQFALEDEVSRQRRDHGHGYGHEGDADQETAGERLDGYGSAESHRGTIGLRC